MPGSRSHLIAKAMHNAITDVAGIRVGHYTNKGAATGCTVVLCEEGAVGGVDVRGSAPGSRETDLLRPMNLVQQAHAVLLSGGSAFGLDAASGAMRYLEERGVGFRLGPATVPIVPAAILFDLGLVTHKIRPGLEDGYKACEAAAGGPVEEGSVGAGTGATVGKALGMALAIKGGLGTASVDLGDGIVVGAIVAVNAFGSVVDPDTGQVIAGPRREDAQGFHDTMKLVTAPGYRRPLAAAPTNTTIGVVATSASLSKEQANKLASASHDGLAMAIRPAHTMGDGDIIFALATGRSDSQVDMNRMDAAAALCVSRAIIRAVLKAEGLGGVPAAREILRDVNL